MAISVGLSFGIVAGVAAILDVPKNRRCTDASLFL
jgi:hypothetical protein